MVWETAHWVEVSPFSPWSPLSKGRARVVGDEGGGRGQTSHGLVDENKEFGCVFFFLLDLRYRNLIN